MKTSKISGYYGELNYSIHPGGGKILLAFHGFGQNNSALLPVIGALSNEYAIYAFNHFFHG